MITDVKVPGIEHITPKSDYELRKLGIRPERLVINRGEFSKSAKEKAELKEAKKEHNKALLKAGFSPSERLNLNDPQIFKFASI